MQSQNSELRWELLCRNSYYDYECCIWRSKKILIKACSDIILMLKDVSSVGMKPFLTMRPSVGIIISSSRLLLFFNGGSFPTRHVEVVLVIFLEKSWWAKGPSLSEYVNIWIWLVLYTDNVLRLAVLSILLATSIHGKGDPSQISFDDLWKLPTKYFFGFC